MHLWPLPKLQCHHPMVQCSMVTLSVMIHFNSFQPFATPQLSNLHHCHPIVVNIVGQHLMSQYIVINQLWLSLLFLILSPKICCICLCYLQNKCRLSIWSPLCPQDSRKCNEIMLAVVGIIHLLYCLVVARNWIWILLIWNP